MKLASALASDFDDGVRSRGVSYFRTGAVRIQRASDSDIQAVVRGSRSYEVEIEWDGGQLTLFCDCAFFESGGPCKHLWATILAADARNCFTVMTRLTPDQVFYDMPDPFDELDDEDDDHDDFEPYYDWRSPRRPAVTKAPSIPKPPPIPLWKQRLGEVTPKSFGQEWPPDRQLLYVIDVTSSKTAGCLILNLLSREPKKTSGWKKLQAPRLHRSTFARLPDPADREILGLLTGCGNYSYWMASDFYEALPDSFRLHHPFASVILPRIVATGRGMLRGGAGDADLHPLSADDGEPWQFRLRLTREKSQCVITGALRRGEEEISLATPQLVVPSIVVMKDRVSRLEEEAPFEWISTLRQQQRIEAPAAEIEQVCAALIEHPLTLRLDVPADLRYEEVSVAPKPCLTVRAETRSYEFSQGEMRGQLDFDYDGRRVPHSPMSRGLYEPDSRRFLLRDPQAEDVAKQLLRQLGVSEVPAQPPDKAPSFKLAPKKLPAVARACLEAGWHIEAEGKIFRRPGEVKVEVSSGIDWFELHGEVDYGGTIAKLPALLAALRRGEKMVRLDDGTYGLLPEEWLSRFGQVAGLGAAEADHLRFRRNQAGLLDALLAVQPEVTCDETFARVRDELRHFDGIRRAEQPARFTGQLREYQREGVGWMEFLRRFGFGGCLADDMGVGKTAQVLALLEQRRTMRSSNGHGDGETPSGPSLVVVPRSLVFNWKQEAARFTPELRVLDHTGVTRDASSFAGYDLILTTYGTLRRDAASFKDQEFDYIVLDEAQAIKNAGTESAKAARLLRGRHRLALSGTPVENHLGELWSIFEFLNPGMLGAASVFNLAGGAARNPSEETRRMLSHALRPFILRRTKEQVASELPQKSEQTIFCEMEAAQRRLYDELRAHYRSALLGTIARQGLAKSKIQVLEALLRLRQAACHPGLLDPKRRGDPSAKLEVLTSRLGEVVEEGHKALVFSQFTSMLSIVRERLDKAGIVYEYLDGATHDRQKCVERFQNDSKCGLFLISLKAGGLGLNLTAAEYVFLMDPWWNPAVEAQAVDRAHRIGQTKQVFAYRLIARDTVEEKILQLQNSKRDLAAAIISADNSLIGNLKQEDLELLLS